MKLETRHDDGMQGTNDEELLGVWLDSWDRNNRILVNLARAVPEGGMEARVMAGSPSVAEMFSHIHYVRLIFISEDAPEFSRPLPAREWMNEGNVERIAEALESSAVAVREAVKSYVVSGKSTQQHFYHPMLFIQQMIWHEGYHHGQIKLALKMAGKPLANDVIGKLTWRVWMNKTQKS